MVVEVYPIKRLPRRFRVFDYLVPEHLTLQRGDFVLVPWRNRLIWGVAAKVKRRQPREIQLKTVSDRLEGLSLSNAELDFFEQTALDLVQSVSSILYAAFPKIPKRANKTTAAKMSSCLLTLPKSEIPRLRETLEKMENFSQAFIFCTDLRRAAAIIAGRARTTQASADLAICANARDAELLAASLRHHQPIFVSGGETPIARWQAWRQWRERGGLLIGTRLGAWLTHPNLKNIYLLRSGSNSHKQADRNPRYDTRRLAGQLKIFLGAKLWFMDGLPRADDLIRFSAEEFLGQPNPLPVTLIEKQKEKISAPHPAISGSSVELIERALLLGQRVICVYNRKGLARALKCQACAFDFPCERCGGRHLIYERTIRCHRCDSVSPLPVSCPRCRGTNLLPRGFGNRLLARALQKLFPQNFVSLIEKDNVMGAGLEAEILVVTNFWLEHHYNPFLQENIGLIIDLDADMALFEQSNRAMERTFQNLEDWRGAARANRAGFALQTDNADLFRAYLTQPRQALQNELRVRRDFGQPPFRRTAVISAKRLEAKRAEADLGWLGQTIRTIDPQAELTLRRNTQEWELCFDPNLALPILRELAKLDDGYIIDSSADL